VGLVQDEVWLRSSVRQVRIQRSMIAFMRGARMPVVMVVIRSARARHDEWLCEQIMTVWKDNFRVYRVPKV
jgi:hypothetical protein